jgi:mRNA interferase MazF
VLAAHGEDVIVLGIFSRIPPRAFPETWVYIDQGRPGFRSSGLRKASLIKAEKIAVVHRSILEKRLGSIDPNLVAEVDKALKAALHLG